jgi:hypothetical protein
MRSRAVVVVLAAALLGACSDPEPSSPPDPPTAPAPTSESTSLEPSPASEAAPEPARADPGAVRVGTAMRAVRRLARDIGPRPGTTRAFHEAAEWVADELRAMGWDVAQQSFPVPAGTSHAGPTEGLPVEAGRSTNVIASRGRLVPGEPWLLVGAHLDTVPTSPGAEDNASGVGALLAVAEAVGDRRTRLPVVLVAFGAEEPRGPTDDDHHYGSRAYVAELTGPERRSLRGMVALDRVGQRGSMPVGSADPGDPLVDELVEAARRVGVPVLVESGQRSSDHWSFVRAGLPGVRIGSIPYAGYHSPADAPAGVDPVAVRDVARIVVRWLR